MATRRSRSGAWPPTFLVPRPRGYSRALRFQNRFSATINRRQMSAVTRFTRLSRFTAVVPSRVPRQMSLPPRRGRPRAPSVLLREGVEGRLARVQVDPVRPACIHQFAVRQPPPPRLVLRRPSRPHLTARRLLTAALCHKLTPTRPTRSRPGPARAGTTPRSAPPPPASGARTTVAPSSRTVINSIKAPMTRPCGECWRRMHRTVSVGVDARVVL